MSARYGAAATAAYVVFAALRVAGTAVVALVFFEETGKDWGDHAAWVFAVGLLAAVVGATLCGFIRGAADPLPPTRGGAK